MKNEVTIIIVDDDLGHAMLIEKNLTRSGLTNPIIKFKDGQEVLDFLFRQGNGQQRKHHQAYLMLLDIRMPKVDGIEVLRQVKEDPELKKMPVIMLTTTDDPREVEKCHTLGCSNFIVKPVDSDRFIDSIRQLGLFLTIVEVPHVNGQINKA
jgi:CheY-like chemotaxis protein